MDSLNREFCIWTVTGAAGFAERRGVHVSVSGGVLGVMAAETGRAVGLDGAKEFVGFDGGFFARTWQRVAVSNVAGLTVPQITGIFRVIVVVYGSAESNYGIVSR